MYVNSPARRLGYWGTVGFEDPKGQSILEALKRKVPPIRRVNSTPVESDERGSRLPTERIAVEIELPSVSPDTWLLPQTEPGQTAAFQAAWGKLVPEGSDAIRAQVWSRFLREPSTLSLEDRLRNALVRHIQATRMYPNADPFVSSGESAPLRPPHTAVLKSEFRGISLRDEPWGEEIAQLPGGSEVEVVARTGGGWLKVRSGNHEGFLAEIWLSQNS